MTTICVSKMIYTSGIKLNVCQNIKIKYVPTSLEKVFYLHCKNLMFKLLTKGKAEEKHYCLVNRASLCDGWSSCLTDECGCDDGVKVFYCADKNGCIAMDQVKMLNICYFLFIIFSHIIYI